MGAGVGMSLTKLKMTRARTGVVLTVLVVAIVAGASIYMFGQHGIKGAPQGGQHVGAMRNAGPGDGRLGSSSLDRGNAPGKGLLSNRNQSTEQVPTKPWNGVTTFADLQASLAAVSDAERISALMHAARACEAVAYAEQFKSDSGTGSSANDRFFDTFCQSYSGGLRVLEKQYFDLPASNEVVQAKALFGIDDTPEGKAVAVSKAKRIVLSTQGPAAFKAAARYLVASGAWDAGSDLVRSSVQAQHLREAQSLAVEMLVCRLSGGCGAYEWSTMVLCGHAHRCAPGVTAYDIWRYTHSPMVYDLAAAIEAELLTRRASYP